VISYITIIYLFINIYFYIKYQEDGLLDLELDSDEDELLGDDALLFFLWTLLDFLLFYFYLLLYEVLLCL